MNMADGLYDAGTRLKVVNGHLKGEILHYRKEVAAPGDPEQTVIIGEPEKHSLLHRWTGGRIGDPYEAVFASDVELANE